MQKITAPETMQDTAFRQKIETIAFAACRIRGLPDPDPAMLDRIVIETSAIVARRPAAELEDHLDEIVRQIAAQLS